MNCRPAFRLRLFGNPSIVADGGAVVRGPAAQRHRIALLALLARSPNGALGRERLTGYLWPERATEHARQLLNQAVYQLRKTLGDDALLSDGNELRLNARVVGADVAEFEAACEAGGHARAVTLFAGPFLDGFSLSDAPEFDHWADRERERLAGAYGSALEALAAAAEETRDFAGAVELWKMRGAHDPYDSRVALRLIRALETCGNRAGALQHARAHERLLREELGMGSPHELQASVERLCHAPAATSDPGASRTSPAVPPQQGVEPAVPAAAAPEGSAPAPMTGPRVPPPTAYPPRDGSPVNSPAGGTLPTRRLPRRLVGAGAVLAACCVLVVALRSGRTDADSGQSRERPPTARMAVRGLEAGRATRADASFRRPTTRNVAAYDLYRRGSDRTRLRSDSAAREGVELLQQAVALDPTYAAAWAELALMHYRLGLMEHGSTLPRPVRVRQRGLSDEAARKAVTLDDSLAAAHLIMGKVRMAGFDFAAAERELTRAIALDPTSPEPHEALVTLYLWTSRPEEALAHGERAVALDSLSPAAHAEAARALAGLDRCDDALARLAPLAHMRPPLLRVAHLAAQCYARKRMWAAGVTALAPQAERGVPSALAQTAYLLARAGRRREALQIRETLRERWRRGEGGAFPVGLVYAGLGDLDEAFDWFERGVADYSLDGHESNLGLVVPGPLSEDVQRHPRFAHLRERLHLQPR